jgi:hypothetical protein
MATLKGHTKISSILNAKPGSILPGGKGSSIPFMKDGRRSWSGKGPATTGSGSGQQDMHALLGSSETKVKEEVSSDEDVLPEAVPGPTEVIFSD